MTDPHVALAWMMWLCLRPESTQNSYANNSERILSYGSSYLNIAILMYCAVRLGNALEHHRGWTRVKHSFFFAAPMTYAFHHLANTEAYAHIAYQQITTVINNFAS